MILITTPNGNIGSQVIPHLLDAVESLRVVLRDPSKLPSDLAKKVESVTGSLDDETFMEQALEGIESVFLVVPPSFKENNDKEYYLRFTYPTVKAARKQSVRRIVDVSTLGRGTELARKAGPVTASLAKDAEIESSGIDYRALWCPSLMENILDSVQTIRQQGLIVSTSKPDVKAPQVATKDIAKAAAMLLLDKSWTGQGGRAVLGPEDLSFDDMAAIVSDVLRKPVRFQQVSEEEYKAQLIQHGANSIFAQGIVDMLAAKSNGLDNAEKRTSENTTPTSFRQWCEDILKPAIDH